jgi:hypothetical protein
MVALKVGRALAVGIVAVALSGVAVVADAATKSSGYTACSNSHHVLAVSKHGKCAKHFHKVKLGARGPAGPSDVYAADGSVSFTPTAPAVTPGSRRANRPAVVAPPLTLTLPAGSYLLTWRVDMSVRVLSGGEPDEQDNTATLTCTPEAVSRTGATFGLSDIRDVPLSPTSYDNSTGVATFDLRTPLSDLWPLKVPAGGVRVIMSCPEPTAHDEFGAELSLDSDDASGQLVATKVGTLHQVVASGR